MGRWGDWIVAECSKKIWRRFKEDKWSGQEQVCVSIYYLHNLFCKTKGELIFLYKIKIESFETYLYFHEAELYYLRKWNFSDNHHDR